MTISQSMLSSGNIKLGVGTYVLPPNFSYDYGDKDISITGIFGKTIITSYDGKASTNFKPIKLDTTKPDTYIDGIYVVWKHPIYSYGGGQAHLNLRDVYNTNNLNCWYTQGTILKKVKGVWSRHYTGYGFKTKGNITVKNIKFDNCQFYLFSPFGLNTTNQFLIDGCSFKNISRVIASMLYAGIDQSDNWFINLQYYSSFGVFRFKNFIIKNSVFENIHTSICWGFPPSEYTEIVNNTVKNSETMIAGFNFFMKNYNDNYYFANRSTQIVTGNTFTNINTQNGWTTSLIRTAGKAIIDNNKFINNSPQVTYFYGGDSSFTNNTVDSNIISEMQLVTILTKSSESLIYINNNQISTKNNILLAVEGQSSCFISDNKIVSKVVYSRNDNTNFLGEVVISRNDITSPVIANANSKVPITFNKLIISDNTLYSLEAIKTGNVNIDEFIYDNNIIKK